MYLLQSQTIEKSASVLFNYGAIGALLVLCIFAIIFLVRFFIKQNEKRDLFFTTQINEMNSRMNKYIEEDRKEMIKVINDNTQAMRELQMEIHRGKN